MLFDRYVQNGQLFNTNFVEAATRPGFAASRGDLALVEGEIGDAQGRRKPPTEVLRQAVLLSEGDKLALFSGSLDDILQLPTLVAKYQPDFHAGTMIVLFVVNIPAPAILITETVRITLIPLQDGMVWNELTDLVALEKEDFKGLSVADKVLKVFDCLADFKPKYPQATLESVIAGRTSARREGRGPV